MTRAFSMAVGCGLVKTQKMRSGGDRRAAERRLMRVVGCLVCLCSLFVAGCDSADSMPKGAGGTAASGAPASGAAGEPNVPSAGTSATGGTGASAAGGGAGTPSAAGGDAGTPNALGGAGNSSSGSGGLASSAGADTAGGANGGAAGASPDGFSLLFRDDFDALDLTRWQLMTHSWESNLALFSAAAVTVEAGELRVALTPAPSGTVDSGGVAKSFLGAEVRSVQAVNYGRVRARMRFARGSAVVSSLVTIYTPWPADDWNELDIECLGKDPAHTQFNAMVYTGPPVTPPATTSVTPTQEPKLVDLGFDPSVDFHVYTIEWTPEEARFLVDEVVRHTWSTRIDLMGLPQNVLMTIWASSSVTWAGPVNETTGQAVAVYDWLELYQYAAP
jgi:endo-1,3-1,4-beta-glycanase ExoK